MKPLSHVPPKRKVRGRSCSVRDPEFQRLRARVERRYATARRLIWLGGVPLEFTRVADPEQVLQRMGDRESPAWQPYWAESWESGEALAAELLPRDLSGQSILDLGCGMGLTGTIAAALGARVLFADAARPALLFARLNSWPWKERVRLRAFDWRRDGLRGEQFSMILGADILYDPEDWPFLERLWRRNLSDRGCVLLGEPGRRACRGFSEWMAERHWSVRCRDPRNEAAPNGLRILEVRPAGR